MMQDQPEGFQHEGPFGHIPGIPVLTTWNSRQVSPETLSRTSLTTLSQGGVRKGQDAHPQHSRNFWREGWRLFHRNVWGVRG